MLFFVEPVCKSIDSNNIDQNAPLDLPELFDSISYDVQKEKLSIIGSNSDAQNLLIFFPNRLQRVKLDSIHCNWMKVIRGVTEETVLGPLLFNLYVSDLCTANDTDVTMIQDADHCLIWLLTRIQR